jgi:hypothetical protein
MVHLHLQRVHEVYFAFYDVDSMLYCHLSSLYLVEKAIIRSTEQSGQRLGGSTGRNVPDLSTTKHAINPDFKGENTTKFVHSSSFPLMIVYRVI